MENTERTAFQYRLRGLNLTPMESAEYKAYKKFAKEVNGDQRAMSLFVLRLFMRKIANINVHHPQPQQLLQQIVVETNVWLESVVFKVIPDDQYEQKIVDLRKRRDR